MNLADCTSCWNWVAAVDWGSKAAQVAKADEAIGTRTMEAKQVLGNEINNLLLSEGSR